MKAQSIGNPSMLGVKKLNKGMITLEILIAFTVFVLCLGAVIMVVFGNQSIAIDLETNNEAISKAKKMLEDARANSRKDFLSIVSDPVPISDGIYNKQIIVDPTTITQCKKGVASIVSWNTGSRALSTTFSTFLSDIAGALALGGDCVTDPSSSNWDSPARFASDTFNLAKPTTIDVLNKIIYLGSDKPPFLEIADTNKTTFGQNNGLFVTYLNNFDLGTAPNSIDVIKWTDPITGNVKKYAYLAMNTTTDQLKIVDVTDIRNPVLMATQALSSCVTGSAPQGWKLYAYKDRLYFLTRYTAGPEFHIFNISNPINPLEFGAGACKGFELGDTAESIEVRDQNINASTIRFVYLATDENDKELRVLNVTNPLSITNVNTANQDLPGAQDGESVYIVGNKLYFGRQSAPSGPDLYVFNISNPTTSLTLLGSQDIGTGVIGIRVVGVFGFLATVKAKKEFQVWNISDPTNISFIKEYNFGNIISQGIDYEPDFIYATGQSTPNFQILYDNTP